MRNGIPSLMLTYTAHTVLIDILYKKINEYEWMHEWTYNKKYNESVKMQHPQATCNING